MKLLITGANGQLGLALTRRLSRAPDSHEVIALDHTTLDISSLDKCREIIEQHKPDVVLNCAAYTAVDRAESERDAAFLINADGAKNLAIACNEIDAMLIHFSTDYVFDGSATRPYVESDTTAPLGVYGESKLAGEAAVSRYAKHYAIIRLSWVYSNDGANFYKTMLRLAAERPTLRVVADQRGIPNFTGYIADAMATMLRRSKRELQEKSGIYHVSATNVTTWSAFASTIVNQARLANVPSVESITTADYPTPAKRPAFSALDSSRFAATFGWRPDDWQAGLDRCLAERAMSA
jgi:dTDP-4-dehydrorhamnose reductase